MKRKGISPLIAAVLLIAFTMAVASIFAQWAPQIFKGTQEDVSEERKQVIACSEITLDVISSNRTHATVQLSSGSLGDRNVSVTWYYENSPPVQVSNASISETQNLLTYDLGDFSGKTAGDTLDRVEASPTGC